MSKAHKRRKKLVRPGLQLRIGAVFAGLLALMLGLQFALLTAELSRMAGSMPADGRMLLERTNGLSLKVTLISAFVFLPLTLLVGVLSTFKIAGPIHRFRMFLVAVRDGERPADFRLRKGDEFKDIAVLLNDVTRPLREAGGAGTNAQDPTSTVAVERPNGDQAAA